ncbi:MAG: M28 family peptidase [Bacteroidales bacterium]|nr:M28 family peptidase [Bacteroidales bacterium]
MKKIFILLIISFYNLNLYSQDIKYAHNILDSLCSNNYYGRGYSFDGDKIACYYLANELKSFNLKPILQPFNVSVNVFDNNADIFLEEQKLIAGKDFNVNPISQSLNKTVKLFYLNSISKSNLKKLSKILTTKDSNTTIIFDTTNIDKDIINKYYNEIQKHNKEISKLSINFVKKLPPQGIASKQERYSEFYILNKYNNGKKLNINFDAQLKFSYITNNIIAIKKGEVDTFQVVTAHYDHVGTLGKNCYFPGAHDNASRCAMVMDLAKYFSKLPKTHYSLAFILFSGEELGLLGSYNYVRKPIFPLEKIKNLINLDMLGSGDEGIMIVNGSVLKEEFSKFQNINKTNNYVPQILSRGEAANSDHYYFYKKGVKSMYIYTMGQYKEYHNINDKSENIPMPIYDGIFNLVKDFITE